MSCTSARHTGRGTPWYRRAIASGTGRVRAAGIERDVAFAQGSSEAQGDIDAAYHAKYDRYGPRIVGSVTGPEAHQVTIRLVPSPARRNGAMAVSETAQNNHDELFPGHISTLKVTDPELIEIFGNFAFDETLQHIRLDSRTRLMVQLAALVGCQALSEYRVMLGAALTIGVTPVEAREIIYQAVPYAGMGKVLDFIHATNEVLSEHGAQLPLGAQGTTTPATRAEKGRAIQEQIIGAGRVEHMFASAAGDELHVQQFLSANCFGDYYTRTGIDVATRQLLTFAMLAALGGCDPQVKGHVAANLSVGNDRQTLISVLTALLPFIGYPRTLNALAAINQAAPAPQQGQ